MRTFIHFFSIYMFFFKTQKYTFAWAVCMHDKFTHYKIDPKHAALLRSETFRIITNNAQYLNGVAVGIQYKLLLYIIYFSFFYLSVLCSLYTCSVHTRMHFRKKALLLVPLPPPLTLSHLSFFFLRFRILPLQKYRPTSGSRSPHVTVTCAPFLVTLSLFCNDAFHTCTYFFARVYYRCECG